MKGNRFKEEQIIRILHEAERGMTAAEVCREPTNDVKLTTDIGLENSV